MSDLISKRAALEVIQKAYDEVEVPKEDGDNLLEVQVACGVKVGVENALLAVMDVPSLWVSVNDAMPVQAHSVLVRYAINGTTLMDVAAVWAGRQTKRAVFRDRVGTLIRDVTHWMELHAPPVG